MSSLSLEEAKTYLKKNSGGANLYDHLSDVLLKILVEKPENACDAFEQISATLKQTRFIPSTDQTNNVVGPLEKIVKENHEKWCDTTIGLFHTSSEDDELPENQALQDLVDEANMFEWAGIGFSREETFRLSLALRKLASASRPLSLRLWGKYLGVNCDYYIAEGELEEKYEPTDGILEEGSDGANKNTYWAMLDDGNYVWVQLPHVTQAQILAARKMRKLVTGNLNAKVEGNPPFPGKEMNYLRAQIARISSSTVICPAGIFQVDDDDGNIIPVEDPGMRSIDELLEIKNWVHLNKDLNEKYARCTHMPPKTDDENEEAWEGDELIEPLRSLDQDATTSWRTNKLPGSTSIAVGQLAVLKSLVWPGAASIGHGLKFLNIYVGYGIKHDPNPFQPPLPGIIQSEYGLTATQSEENSSMVWSMDELKEQMDVLENPVVPTDDEDTE